MHAIYRSYRDLRDLHAFRMRVVSSPMRVGLPSWLQLCASITGWTLMPHRWISIPSSRSEGGADVPCFAGRHRQGQRGSVGAFYNHPKLGYSIFVNADTAPGRQTFTMAHEFAHALFHYPTVGVVSRKGDRDPKERFADAFAAHFLVPAACSVSSPSRAGERTESSPTGP